MDRIIFGDNQFFGINHMSEDKAQALYERFHDLNAITDVIGIAYDCGIRGFMLNANDRAGDICDFIRKNKERFTGLNLYPSIPYPHKYANLVNEKGIFTAVTDIIVSDNSAKNIVSLLGKSVMTLFDKDVTKVMEMLVDIEMKIFHGLNVRVVFLQNVVTDLVLGLGAKEIFPAFADHIRKRYNAEPGFITMNLPKLRSFLLSCGVQNPVICASINNAGYFMNPDVSSYEAAIREGGFSPVAMSVLASGAIRPADAVAYVCSQPNIRSIVFGASTRKHIEETVGLIKRFSSER